MVTAVEVHTIPELIAISSRQAERRKSVSFLFEGLQIMFVFVLPPEYAFNFMLTLG
jgi:hypothetical protein